MGTSSGRITEPKTTMSNRNRRSPRTFIDLTESFTLADHNGLNNVVINLDTDDSFVEENIEIPRPRRDRKRRHPRTRPTSTETTVVDISTPEGKKQEETQKNPDVAAITDEPKEKRARRSIGPCPICFEEFDGQALLATKCGHVYCARCLEMALRVDPKCPTCRTPLKGRNRHHPIFFT